MKKIGIVGNGYVGGATALLKHDNISIYIYDTEYLSKYKLTEGYSSASAEKMTISEMEELVWNTK